MIIRPLLVLTSLLSLVLAGYWPVFVERAILSARQIVGLDDTDVTASEAVVTPQRTAAVATAAVVATAATQVAAAATEEVATVAAAAATATAAATTRPRTAAAATTSTAAAAVAAAAAADSAAAAAAAAAANSASFEIPYEQQTGAIRYAPMPKKVGTKITVKNATPLYPTSAWNIYTENVAAGTVVATVTQAIDYTTPQQREATDIPAAAPPVDTAMQKFLNRWKD